MPNVQVNEMLEKTLFPYKKEFPEFNPGDTVKVSVRIREGETERTQAFEGVIIRKRGSGFDRTFTIRKISFGVGVERIFPYYSPTLEKIEVVKRGSVRRAKLYYLRNVIGKAAKIEEAQADSPAVAPAAAPETKKDEGAK